MNKCGIRLLSSIRSMWTPQTELVRFRHWTPEHDRKRIFRYGYDDDHFYTGLLPRGNFDRLSSAKIYRPQNVWNKKKRTFGQNDYIDILGDERLHPLKLADNIPGWLKGFKGTELDMLRLRMDTFRHKLPHLKPLRWKKMQSRFEQCFYFSNFRQKVGLPKV